ncbi:reverse transcriptase domain-containing protein [Tanacetum coccineum]
MYTRGRKKAEAEPAPPARDPRDVETIERLQQRIQELELQQLQPDSPAEEAKTEPNVWDDEPVDLNPFGGRKHRYVNRLYQPRRNDHAVDRDDRYSDDPIRSLGLKIEIPEFIEAFLDYHNLSQQNMTVKEVINEFDKLRIRCDVVEEEEQVVARFLGVLKPEIADIVSLQTYWTYTDIYKLALKVEKQIKAKSNTREHVDNAPRCYECGGLRHYAHDCLNLKTLAFVPNDASPIYDTDAEPKVNEPSDELVYPDREEALVIQRVLNVAVSKSDDDNSWLRNNIFRIKCTSKGKICDMIIDGGSCENVVSTYMVEKLGMKTEDHPKPYQLTWLKKRILLKSVNVVLCSFLLVMATPVISISSDVSVESVRSSFPRIILIDSISVEAPVAPEVGAAAVASPARVLELSTHSLLEADPSESSPPPVSIPERHVSPTTSTPKIPTAPILPAPSAIVAPSSEYPLAPVVSPPGTRRRRAILIQPREDIPIGRLYHPYPGGPCRALTVRKSVRPLPSHRLALRYTSHHLDNLTSGSSSIHSSSDHSSSGHSISGHSLSGHTPPDTTDADSSTPLRFVHPSLARTPRYSEAYLY